MAEQTKYKCVKVCFYRNRLWGLGESLTPSDGEKVPKFFVPEAKAPVEVKPQPEKPETLLGIQKAENEAEAKKAEKVKKAENAKKEK